MRHAISVDGVYDIETETWDRFVVGALLTRDGYKARWWDREGDLVDDLLAVNGTVWAHNGGRYDALWFLSHMIARGYKASVGLAGSRVTRVQVGKLTLRDSAALVPMALSKASEIGGTRKVPTDLPCHCPRYCGGYCAIKRGMPRALRSRLLTYLEADCRATLAMLDALTDYADRHDLDLSGTIGMSSWQCASREVELDAAEWDDPRLYRFARKAYSGGRCQVLRPRSPAGHRYDMVSAYPAALSRLALPTGERRELHGPAASRAYGAGREGVYHAIVEVPNWHIPPLPYHFRDRVAYPVGRFDGVWTGVELRAAQENGARVQQIGHALAWTESAKLLAPFCRRIWKLREAAGPKTGLGTWLKLYANSLTGKLAQNPEAEAVILNPETVNYCPADWDCIDGMLHGTRGGCCVHRCTGACKRWSPLDRLQKVWARPIYRIPDCGHVHYAAYLTAWTRIQVGAQLRADGAGGESACYCDTDSCYAESPRGGVGDALGQWKYEGAFRDFTSYAPKTYAYWNPDTGEYVARAKGIPDAARNWTRLTDGVELDAGVETFRTALRDPEHLFRRKHMVRKIAPGALFGDRRLDGDLTRPLMVRELAEVIQ